MSRFPKRAFASTEDVPLHVGQATAVTDDDHRAEESRETGRGEIAQRLTARPDRAHPERKRHPAGPGERPHPLEWMRDRNVVSSEIEARRTTWREEGLTRLVGEDLVEEGLCLSRIRLDEALGLSERGGRRRGCFGHGEG
jgi:hypothetical protein